MTESDIESDAFLKLLTEAMRAGPGSPEWRQAVERVRASGASGEEYQLLLTAREHLESGKEYRSIGAGPDFTRKVMEGLDADANASSRPGFDTTRVVAGLGGMLVVGVIVLVAMLWWKSSDATNRQDLAALYFPTTTSLSTFDSFTPDGWRKIGMLPVIVKRGLRPQSAPASAGEVAGGGIVSAVALPTSVASAVEVTLDASAVSEDVAAQIFLTDQPQFSEDRATSDHELVWLAKGTDVRVITPDGKVVSPAQTLPASAGIVVRFVVNKTHIIVSSNNTTLYTGPHQLDPARPHLVGIRFLIKPGVEPVSPAITSVRFLGLGEK